MAQYYEDFQAGGQRFIIRNARGSDAGQEIDFVERTNLETDFSTREPGEYRKAFLPVEKEAEALEEMSQSDSQLYLLATTPGGEIAATCLCTRFTGRERRKHLGDISIGVSRRFWRMGLGRRLFEIQLEWAKSSGVEVLTLEVDTRNLPAIGLYLSQGFAIEGVLRGRVKMPDGGLRDFYSMSKLL